MIWIKNRFDDFAEVRNAEPIGAAQIQCKRISQRQSLLLQATIVSSGEAINAAQLRFCYYLLGRQVSPPVPDTRGGRGLYVLCSSLVGAFLASRAVGWALDGT